MTTAQLQAARDVLNLSALSVAVGLAPTTLGSYLYRDRELPADVQARLDDVLEDRGLLVEANINWMQPPE